MNIRINFTSPETRRIVLPDAENRTIVSSFIWTQYRNVMDERTDRQTESLWLLQRSALRAMRTRCKNYYHERARNVGPENQTTVKHRLSLFCLESIDREQKVNPQICSESKQLNGSTVLESRLQFTVVSITWRRGT